MWNAPLLHKAAYAFVMGYSQVVPAILIDRVHEFVGQGVFRRVAGHDILVEWMNRAGVGVAGGTGWALVMPAAPPSAKSSRMLKV